jgi:hypothetical protein
VPLEKEWLSEVKTCHACVVLGQQRDAVSPEDHPPTKSVCDEEKRENKSEDKKAKMTDPKIFPQHLPERCRALFRRPSHAITEMHPVMQGVASADMHMQLADHQRIASIQSSKRPRNLRNTHTHTHRSFASESNVLLSRNSSAVVLRHSHCPGDNCSTPPPNAVAKDASTGSSKWFRHQDQSQHNLPRNDSPFFSVNLSWPEAPSS